jgi:replication-associated recombination protein RarA
VTDYLDDVVGQETAKTFIRNAIKKDNLYNLLFVGPRGVGKRMMAFALAKTLNCPPQSQNFSLIAPIPSRIKEKDEKIHEYSQKYLPDNPVVATEDRVSILIDQIRNLDERLMHMPNLNTKRIVLVLEADQMTDEAANRFLKTLEEPPVDTIFVLTSSRPDYVLPTIRSRCRIIPFTCLKAEQIKKIVFDGTDDFMLGSAGEVLSFRESGIVDAVIDVFRKTPLTLKAAAELAYNNQRMRVVELYYPLLLLYRLVLYRKLNIVGTTRYDRDVNVKAKRVATDKVIQTIRLLNDNIILVESNANKLLQLFNVLLRLP